MGKRHIEFLEADKVNWTVNSEDVCVKLLNLDKTTGADTILVFMRKGTGKALPQAHVASEEIFVLSGKILITKWSNPGRNGETSEAGKGTYMYTPGGILHGPWSALEDTVTLEIHDRYFRWIFNPEVWECQCCHDKLLWEMTCCSNCGTAKHANARMFKPIERQKTIYATPTR
jgi:hypothetical protein